MLHTSICYLSQEGCKLIIIDLRSRVPIYKQIKNQIMELVILGVLKPNDVVPSIRALAKDLSLNFNTVKKAFAELEADGVIYTVVGKGTYIADGAMDNTQIKTRAIKQFNTALSSAISNGLTKEQITKLVDKAYNSFGKDVDN